MPIKLFGFTIGKTEPVQVQPPEQPALVLPQAAIEDGAVTITQGAYYGTYVDLEGSVRNELELVSDIVRWLSILSVRWQLMTL